MYKTMNIKPVLFSCLILVLLFLFSGISFSTERELLLLMDVPTVVTASKTEQPINEAPEPSLHGPSFRNFFHNKALKASYSALKRSFLRGPLSCIIIQRQGPER